MFKIGYSIVGKWRRDTCRGVYVGGKMRAEVKQRGAYFHEHGRDEIVKETAMGMHKPYM